MDNALLDIIKKFEGYNPKAYPDYKQHSIGYGTRATSPNEVIDRAEAERRLQAEVGAARNSVIQFAPHAPPGTQDALTSLTYNAGSKWQGAGLGNAVKSGNWDDAKRRFIQYNRAGGEVNPGLVRRRQEELKLFGAPAGAYAQDSQQTPSNVPPVLQSGFGRESGPGAMPAAQPPEAPGLLAQVQAAAAKPLFKTPDFMGGKDITGKGIMSGVSSMVTAMGKDDEQTKARLRQSALRANADALSQSEQEQAQALQSILARHKRGAFA